jgi:uncharacterized protein YegP (UPF0339 family)
MVESRTTRLSFPAGKDRIVVFADQGGLWRWHRKAANGEIISDSGQGYAHISTATIAARRANLDAGQGVDA